MEDNGGRLTSRVVHFVGVRMDMERLERLYILDGNLAVYGVMVREWERRGVRWCHVVKPDVVIVSAADLQRWAISEYGSTTLSVSMPLVKALPMSAYLESNLTGAVVGIVLLSFSGGRPLTYPLTNDGIIKRTAPFPDQPIDFDGHTAGPRTHCDPSRRQTWFLWNIDARKAGKCYPLDIITPCCLDHQPTPAAAL